MRHNFRVVARPAGVYVPNPRKGLVWRTCRFPATQFRVSCETLANQIGPMRGCNLSTGPDHNAGECAMAASLPKPILPYLNGAIGQMRLDRFWSKVDRRGPDECWPWAGCVSSDGYGSFKLASYYVVTASRFALISHAQAEPKGRHVLHRCDNPICCNPKHLRFGTIAQNARDRVRKGRARGRYSRPRQAA